MTGIAEMIEQIVMDSLLNDKLPLTMRSNTGQGIIALSTFFVFLGTGFFIYGAYLWLGNYFSPGATAMLTGAISIAVSALILTAAYIALQIQKNKVSAFRRSLAQKMQDGLKVLDDEYSGIIRNNPKTSLLAAVISGFLLEERIL